MLNIFERYDDDDDYDTVVTAKAVPKTVAPMEFYPAGHVFCPEPVVSNTPWPYSHRDSIFAW